MEGFEVYTAVAFSRGVHHKPCVVSLPHMQVCLHLQGWSEPGGHRKKGWTSFGACKIFCRLDIQVKAPACLSRISLLPSGGPGTLKILLWAA